jgi:ubiquinone/menaquinone biosynthesis C-methylase UbiE
VPQTIYEHPAWQVLPGKVMRPGGLELTLQNLQSYSLPAQARVLDLGCGLGASLLALSSVYGWQGLGVDISAVSLSRAKQLNPGIDWVQCSAEQLPLRDTCMDLILCECTLSLFEVEPVLAACLRMLKPGGWLLIQDLYARNEEGLEILRQLPPGTCVSGAFARTELSKAIEKKGLVVVQWEDHSEILKDFPLCTLSTTACLDTFDLVIASARAKLGYFSCLARKQA